MDDFEAREEQYQQDVEREERQQELLATLIEQMQLLGRRVNHLSDEVARTRYSNRAGRGTAPARGA